ncbi:apolipoprotein L6-like isoform X2 [Cebus imitator]|uniref:apolipoprotein L6-like isoform X2 n=1 Tax=Cebus imitator TaxID=2715852 RepID=UPI001897872F|nr:apolipoprotein L6-like isoform X2 [Cebus imitator]XP_037585702.1 apolipoprotein L6-like isoform X2 [Cebus imitator]
METSGLRTISEDSSGAPSPAHGPLTVVLSHRSCFIPRTGPPYDTARAETTDSGLRTLILLFHLIVHLIRETRKNETEKAELFLKSQDFLEEPCSPFVHRPLPDQGTLERQGQSFRIFPSLGTRGHQRESSVERRKVVQRLFPARTPAILNMRRIRDMLLNTTEAETSPDQENHLTPEDTDLVPQRLLDNQAEQEYEAGIGLQRDQDDTFLCEDVELQDDLSPEEKIFLREFPRMREDLKGSIDELRALAEDIDKTHKKFTKTKLVANSTAVVSGVVSLLGLALAPATGGGSLLLSAAGQGLGAAATVTSIVSDRLEHSQNRKAQAQAEDILPTHDQEEREAEEERADYVGATVKIIANVINTVRNTRKNVRAFQKVRADPRLANAAKRLLTTGRVYSRSTEQAQKVFAGTTLAMTKNARMLGGTMAAFSLGFDLAAFSKEWKHLKEGARTKFAEELRAKASELERDLTELTQCYQNLQQKDGGGQSTA